MNKSQEKTNPLDRTNAAIKIPEGGLTCEDGRKFFVRCWKPTVKTGGLVTIEMEVIVQFPDGEYAQ
jgi:hypothetical protein